MRLCFGALILAVMLGAPAQAGDSPSALEENGNHSAAIAAAQKQIEALGPSLKYNDPRILDLLNVQGDAYSALGRLDSAEAAYRSVEERTRFVVAGADPAQRIPARVALIHALSGLADLQAQAGRMDQAEALARKARKIADAVLPDGDPARLLMAQRLANVLARTGKGGEAREILAGLAGASSETLPAALVLKTEAQLALDSRDFAEAEGKLRNAIAIIDRLAGKDSDLALAYRRDLGAVLIGAEKFAAAEIVLREALAAAGAAAAQGPDAASTRASLAYALAAREQWEDCLTEATAAEQALDDWQSRFAAAPAVYDGQFVHDLVAVAAWHVMQAHPERKDEMMALAFAAMQRNQSPRAAEALVQMAARQSANDPALADAVRTLQDEERSFAANDARVKAGLGGAGLSTKILYSGAGQSVHDRVAAARDVILQRFPAYRELTGLSQLAPSDVSALLAEDEALVTAYVSRSQVSASAVWAITRENIWWVPLDDAGLLDKMKALRAAIDPNGATRGVAEVSDGAETGAAQGFDTSVPAALYQQLFGDVDELMMSKRRIIVVPSPALAALPFEALARAPAAPGKDVRSADWLIRHAAISVLPSVTALKSLRAVAPPASAELPFAGFGDPDLRAAKLDLAPLPGSVSELQSIAASLRAPAASARLGAAATVAAVKAADLSKVRVVAFATHGLLPGEAEGLREPALVLTPDADGNSLLTASDVAALRLNADFVILSACNTAGGDAESGEGFSGLARAFFYAGTRALLASHWPVYSDAAVKLTTSTLAALAKHPDIGRDEALRRAMVEILDNDPDPRHWDPAYWAPFALIGDSGRRAE